MCLLLGVVRPDIDYIQGVFLVGLQGSYSFYWLGVENDNGDTVVE